MPMSILRIQFIKVMARLDGGQSWYTNNDCIWVLLIWHVSWRYAACEATTFVFMRISAPKRNEVEANKVVLPRPG